MADRIITAGTEDVTIVVRLYDSATGAPAKSLTIGNMDIKIYRLDSDNDVELVQDWIALTALANLVAIHAPLYGYEMDSGDYRIDLPDSACQAGGYETIVLVRNLTVAELCLELEYKIQLTVLDLNTVMRGTDSAALATVLGAAVGASISADIAAVKVDSGQIGTAGAGLSNISLPAGALDNIVMADLDVIPAATAKLVDAINIIFMALRNEQISNSTAGIQSISNDAGTAIGSATLLEGTGLFTKGKYT